MFSSLLELGKNREVTQEVKLPIKKLKNTKGDLCFVIFDNDNKQVRVERYRLYKGAEDDLAYIGNAGPQKDQVELTSNNMKYVIGFDRKDKTSPSEKYLKKKFAIQVVADKLRGTELGEILGRVLNWYKPDPIKYAELKQYKDCALYSVKVMDQGRELTVAKDPKYRELLSKVGDTVDGVCQLCGSQGVLKNPNYTDGSILKIFITDKKGFLPNHSKDNVILAHAICPSCKRSLELGCNFVQQDLVATLGKLNAYIIPDLPKEGLTQFLDLYKPSKEGFLLKHLEDVRKAERDVQETAESLGVEPRLTIVFGKRDRAKFRVWRVIPEVNYMRLIEVVKAFGKAAAIMQVKENPSFNDLYSILPVRETRNGVDPRYFLDFMESLIQDYPLDPGLVYRVFLESIRCKRYNTCENSKTKKHSLRNIVLLQETFIYSMKILGIMGEEIDKQEEVNKDRTPQGVADSLGLRGGKKGLYLLGYLTAQVGKEQAKKGDEKKAILDKIDFEGMDYDDVITFANRLVESLRDYKVFHYNEGVLGEAMRLIAEDRNSLANPQENVFLILLGYSYSTKQIFENSKQVVS
ncbi:hypothetical protein HS7_14420 [Sulfolobales archaeon HS-7]|nr:hypothetical protein HS7_14420 [Sulfolobales archaeon HS-7]